MLVFSRSEAELEFDASDLVTEDEEEEEIVEEGTTRPDEPPARFVYTRMIASRPAVNSRSGLLFLLFDDEFCSYLMQFTPERLSFSTGSLIIIESYVLFYKKYNIISIL